MAFDEASALSVHQISLTSTEREIAALWGEVLQTEVPVTPNENFFSLGGDSLAMTMVLFRVQEVFGVELSTAALLETPELGAFAALVDTALLAADQTIERSTL